MKKLYHGSGVKLEIGDSLQIAKSLSSGKNPVTGKYTPAIYATSDYAYAQFYAMNEISYGGYPMDIRLTSGHFKTIYIMESAEAVYAYIYELNGDNFYLEKTLHGTFGGTSGVKDEWVSFSDEKIVNRYEIGIKQLLAMGHEVLIKKANFQQGADKIQQARRFQEQERNPGQLENLLTQYTLNAKTLL